MSLSRRLKQSWAKIWRHHQQPNLKLKLHPQLLLKNLRSRHHHSIGSWDFSFFLRLFWNWFLFYPKPWMQGELLTALPFSTEHWQYPIDLFAAVTRHKTDKIYCVCNLTHLTFLLPSLSGSIFKIFKNNILNRNFLSCKNSARYFVWIICLKAFFFSILVTHYVHCTVWDKPFIFAT